jgi:hypothetical protein
MCASYQTIHNKEEVLGLSTAYCLEEEEEEEQGRRRRRRTRKKKMYGGSSLEFHRVGRLPPSLLLL